MDPQQEKEFVAWWNNHSTFQGGLSSNLVPKLKAFITRTLNTERAEIAKEIETRIPPIPEGGRNYEAALFTTVRQDDASIARSRITSNN